MLGRHCSGVDCHKCRFSHVERTVAKVIATHRTGGQESRFANIERPALRKLKQLDLARRIDDLRAPPANRLESLKGDRAGQWSLRVNDQFRICFRWTGGDAEDVEIVDYH